MGDATVTTILGLDDLPTWLAGTWRVDRTINDGQGRFTGHAAFQRDGDGDVLWRETGRLALDGHEGPAHRTLRIVAARGTWEVRFDDGRPFHTLDLRAGRWAAEHRCGADVYRGAYTVLDSDRMTVCWWVTGPRRADVIDGEYRRLSAL